jgi:hypothetical protein
MRRRRRRRNWIGAEGSGGDPVKKGCQSSGKADFNNSTRDGRLWFGKMCYDEMIRQEKRNIKIKEIIGRKRK